MNAFFDLEIRLLDKISFERHRDSLNLLKKLRVCISSLCKNSDTYLAKIWLMAALKKRFLGASHVYTSIEEVSGIESLLLASLYSSLACFFKKNHAQVFNSPKNAFRPGAHLKKPSKVCFGTFQKSSTLQRCFRIQRKWINFFHFPSCCVY